MTLRMILEQFGEICQIINQILRDVGLLHLLEVDDAHPGVVTVKPI